MSGREGTEAQESLLEVQLETELADMLQLQQAYDELMPIGTLQTLADELVGAAVDACDADLATAQVFEQPRDELRTLAWRSDDPGMIESFATVGPQGDCACVAALRQGDRVVISDAGFDGITSCRRHGALASQASTIRAIDSTPVRSRSGLTLGVLCTAWRTPHRPDERQHRLLDVLAQKLADALEQRRAADALSELGRSLAARATVRTEAIRNLNLRLRHFAAELTSAEQRERGRLAAVLHDDVQQLLFAAGLQLRRADKLVLDDAARGALGKARELFEAAGASARDLAHQLRPPVLYEIGLAPALDWLAGEASERHGLRVVVDLGSAGHIPLDDEFKILLFESVRELLFNVVKSAAVDEARIALRKGERSLRLLVEDGGRGFDAAAVMRAAPGRGSGLFNIRERFAALGGFMKVESEIGKGTSVELAVPLARPVDHAAIDRQPSETLPFTSSEGAHFPSGGERAVRVLVVDDHALIREGIIHVLSESDDLVVVGEADNGFTAIVATEQQRPDVVLLDVCMPRMDGIDAARQIHRRWPSITIIGLSAQDDAVTERSMLDAGAITFLTKSGDLEHMTATIMQAVNSRRAAP